MAKDRSVRRLRPMLFIFAALVAGLAAGLLTGGSVRRLGELHFRWWPLAIVGLALQFVPVPSSHAGHELGVALLIASYGLLLVFVALNARYVGFVLMGVGFALNILVIGVNGGMPVSAHALRAAAPHVYAQSVARLRAQAGSKHHLERPGDRLTSLADVVGVGRPVGEVYSPGDLIALAGLAVVGAEATGRRRRAHVPKHVARPRGRARAGFAGWVSAPRRP
jgi:hypothetical protein